MGTCALRARFWLEMQRARFRMGVAKAAFEPARHARMWSVLGMGKCLVRTSVSGARRRALSMLLEHGVLGHEPLSVCEVA